MPLHALVLEVELVLPGCRSLKEKRAVLRPILDRVRARYPVGLAEVDHQDVHQRAVLGFAAVSGAATMAERLCDEVERTVWAAADVEVAAVHRHWLEVDT